MYTYAQIERIKAEANDQIAGEITKLDAGPNELRRLALTFGQVRCVLEAAEALASESGRLIPAPVRSHHQPG